MSVEMATGFICSACGRSFWSVTGAANFVTKHSRTCSECLALGSSPRECRWIVESARAEKLRRLGKVIRIGCRGCGLPTWWDEQVEGFCANCQKPEIGSVLTEALAKVAA